LDAASSRPGVNLTISGADINFDTRPFSFNLSDSPDYVLWSLEIPQHLEVPSVRIFDNDKLTNHFVLEGKLHSGSTWEIASPTWIQSKVGQLVDLRIKLVETLLEGFAAFTHVEVILRQRDYLRVQIPQLPLNLNMDHSDPVIYTEFELEPTVGALHRESIIELPQSGLLWKVTEATNKQTSKRQVWGVTGQIRVVQPTEKLNQMRLGEIKDSIFYPNRSLERVQGGLQSGLPSINSEIPFGNQDIATNISDPFNRTKG
jgi:hypothetical protein